MTLKELYDLLQEVIDEYQALGYIEKDTEAKVTKVLKERE